MTTNTYLKKALNWCTIISLPLQPLGVSLSFCHCLICSLFSATMTQTLCVSILISSPLEWFPMEGHGSPVSPGTPGLLHPVR